MNADLHGSVSTHSNLRGNAGAIGYLTARDAVTTEITDGNVAAFERLRPKGADLTLADAQQLVVDTIERMERATLGHLAVADFLLDVATERAGPERPVRVLEVASGSGWLLQNLWRRACRRGLEIELTGSDLNAELVASARRRLMSAEVPATMSVLDACAMADVPTDAYHAAVMTFTLHHFPEALVPSALRELDRVSSGGMAIVDPARRWLALLVVPTLATLVAPRLGHRFAWHDATATVRRSYTVGELRSLVDEAGLRDRYTTGPLPTRHPERLLANVIRPVRARS